MGGVKTGSVRARACRVWVSAAGLESTTPCAVVKVVAETTGCGTMREALSRPSSLVARTSMHTRGELLGAADVLIAASCTATAAAASLRIATVFELGPALPAASLGRCCAVTRRADRATVDWASLFRDPAPCARGSGSCGGPWLRTGCWVCKGKAACMAVGACEGIGVAKLPKHTPEVMSAT